MSKIILTDEALASIIENALLRIDGVKGLYGKRPVSFEYDDSEISLEVHVVAAFNIDLKKLGNEISELVKIEVENITPFKVKDVVVIFEDVVYEP